MELPSTASFHFGPRLARAGTALALAGSQAQKSKQGTDLTI